MKYHFSNHLRFRITSYNVCYTKLLRRHNSQYPIIEIHAYKHAHDRFIIIDDQVYHIGASLKDLGKKLFAFSKLNINPDIILKKL